MFPPSSHLFREHLESDHTVNKTTCQHHYNEFRQIYVMLRDEHFVVYFTEKHYSCYANRVLTANIAWQALANFAAIV